VRTPSSAMVMALTRTRLLSLFPEANAHKDRGFIVIVWGQKPGLYRNW
jgi:hypothetical protein